MRPGLLRESVSEHARAAVGLGLLPWPTLLVVDSDTTLLTAMVCFLEKRGFHVAAASSVAEARAFCDRRRDWAMVIAEYHLNDGNGLELCCWMQEQPGLTHLPFLITSKASSAALCAGVEYLAKPFPLDELEKRVQRLVRR